MRIAECEISSKPKAQKKTKAPDLIFEAPFFEMLPFFSQVL
jgi:hypothetical protein